MADKLKDFAGAFKNAGGGGAPRGLGLGIKLLAGAAASAYGIAQSMYTVDGGHRAIIFSRVGGIQNTIMAEGEILFYFSCKGQSGVPGTV